MKMLHMDIKDYFPTVENDFFDCVVTSPPYNIGVKYENGLNDNLSQLAYNKFTNYWVSESLRVAPVIVVNFGAKTSNQLALAHFALECSKVGVVQQVITWVKSIYVRGRTYGHFKPVNSNFYLANMYEHIYVVSRDGKRSLNKLKVGVPYQDKSNIARRGHKLDRRDRGNVWFVEYETRQAKLKHPATYPVELAELMIKLVTTGGVVLDPFAGTGTTLIAAEKLGLPSVGVDVKDWSKL
jgi:site-specific DNA-methyltransferase (adenine-specific)